jgi:hypothetical protein
MHPRPAWPSAKRRSLCRPPTCLSFTDKDQKLTRAEADLSSTGARAAALESDLQAKAGSASQLQEQVSELQAKLLDASQRDMDNQGAQDALQQQLSTLRCAAGASCCQG